MTEQHTSRFPSGTLYESYTLKDSNYHGKYQRYYDNGHLALECNYVNGVLDGHVKYYYNNGQLKKLCFYKKNQLHGNYTTWAKNGDKTSYKHYVDGLPHGNHKTYYDNGVLESEAFYVNGVLDGEHHSYYKNGMPFDCVWYNMGVVLKTERYHENGQKMLEGEYGKKRGEYVDDWRIYYPNGAVQCHAKYSSDGVLVSCERFLSDGTVNDTPTDLYEWFCPFEEIPYSWYYDDEDDNMDLSCF